MATTAANATTETTAGPAVMRLAEPSAAVCGECMYHIPLATRPGGWCACKTAQSSWMQVSERRPVCDAFGGGGGVWVVGLGYPPPRP